MTVSNRVIQELAVTAELCGTELSAAAAQVMCSELSAYSESVVLGALSRLRREHQGRLTLAAIITRLDDGRPGVEEAWAIYPKEESESAAVTDEMHMAMSSAYPLLMDGDRIGARMAFKEAYERIVSQNRADGIPVRWEVTLGHDRSGRESVIVDATNKGLIGFDYALNLIPYDARDRFLMATGNKDLMIENDQKGIEKVKGIVSGLTGNDSNTDMGASSGNIKSTLDDLKKLFSEN